MRLKKTMSIMVNRFSNRPFRVKRFQTDHHHSSRCRSRARASLRNRHQALPSWESEDEAEQSTERPCCNERQVQAIGRTHLIHRPARDIIPPQGGARVSSYRM